MDIIKASEEFADIYQDEPWYISVGYTNYVNAQNSLIVYTKYLPPNKFDEKCIGFPVEVIVIEEIKAIDSSGPYCKI